MSIQPVFLMSDIFPFSAILDFLRDILMQAWLCLAVVLRPIVGDTIVDAFPFIMGGTLVTVGSVALALGIREEAAVGLILSLATSLSMLPLFGRMDRRGRVMNAAFSVSGAFALGGQMAFIASVEPGEVVAAFVCAKLAGGVCALLAARLFCPAEKEG